MKLITLNIWGGRLRYNIPDFIAKEQPDILCMQEVNDLSGYTGGLFITLDELQQAGNFADKSMAPSNGFHFMNRYLDYGNAVLSKLPLCDRDNVFVRKHYQPDYDVTPEDHARNFQHSSVLINGKIVHIINYQGQFVKGSKAGNDETYQQVKELYGYTVQFANEPIIITGDFNLEPTSSSMQILNNNFRNLPIEHGITSTYSPVLHIFNVVCDYIFINNLVKLQSFETSEAIVSDHKPLIMEFDV
ncbi:MAG: endonuclease/exonuclease/phosphatase family protein [Candidatus Saccharimonadales bacterium]